MANRLTFVAGSFLLFSSILLAAPGCQEADDQLPPPSFHTQNLTYAQPLPAPAAAPPQARVVPRRAEARLPATAMRPSWVSPMSGVPAEWIPHVAVRPWEWIIIHHTATTFGNAAIVTRWHIDRGFDEMGYHFLIGNGTNSGDGQVEVGTRWPKQKWGAHTKSPDNRFNDFGIGICLVGNFDTGYPTAAQIRSLDKLVAYLMKTYHIRPDHVLGHNDCKSTDCPGKHLSVATIRRGALAILAETGETYGPEIREASSGELIRDQR